MHFVDNIDLAVPPWWRERTEAFNQIPDIINAVMGVVEREVLISLLSSIIDKNTRDAVQTVSQIFSTGIDPLVLLREFVTLIREVMLVATCRVEECDQLGIGLDDNERLKELANRSTVPELLEMFETTRNGADQALRSNFPRASFESLVVRLATRDLLSQPRQASERPAAAPVKKKIELAPEPQHAEPAAPSMESAPLESPPESSRKFEWHDFVLSHQKSVGVGMAEHLKRLEVLRFEPCVLEARGPDFSVTYILQSDSRKKLMDELQKFSGKGPWMINLSKVEGKQVFAKGSIREQEKINSEREKEKKD